MSRLGPTKGPSRGKMSLIRICLLRVKDLRAENFVGMIECPSNNVMRIMCIVMLEECDVLFVALHTNFQNSCARQQMEEKRKMIVSPWNALVNV